MRLRYQFVFFADLATLTPEATTVLEIFQKLTERQLGLVPSSFAEIAPPRMAPEPRMRFASPDGSMDVAVPRARLDVIQSSPTLEGPGLGQIGDFIERAQFCVDSVLGRREILGQRLALVVTLFEPESTGRADALYRKLLRAPVSFGDMPPGEWTYRVSAEQPLKFGGLEERGNTILKVERAVGEYVTPAGTQPIKGVVTEIDINTTLANLAPRFSRGIATSFMEAATRYVDRLEQDIQAVTK